MPENDEVTMTSFPRRNRSDLASSILRTWAMYSANRLQSNQQSKKTRTRDKESKPDVSVEDNEER
jgi:hypothetical protein